MVRRNEQTSTTNHIRKRPDTTLHAAHIEAMTKQAVPLTEAKYEPPKAIKAFDDYFALGDKRSLRKLHTQYITVEDNPPTRNINTLRRWSVRFGWVDRAQKRTEELIEERALSMRSRSETMRDMVMDGIEGNVKSYLEQVVAGEAIMIDGALAMERLVRLYFQLCGQPLVDRVDTAAGAQVALNIIVGEQTDDDPDALHVNPDIADTDEDDGNDATAQEDEDSEIEFEG